MKPIVGVLPLWDEERDSIWMLPGYIDAIHGAIPLILPFTTDGETLAQLTALCSGFLFTGGQDVSPALYHQPPLEGLVHCCEKRDAMELRLLKLALAQDKPILGICRGIQLLNAALGGTLYQDLPLEHPSSVTHRQTPPYDLPAHEVELLENTPLSHLLQAERIAVNSYHHQALKTLAPELMPMAISDDGLVEAVFLPRRSFVWAVQWHPEFSHRTDANSRAIFSRFTEAMQDCRRAQKSDFFHV